jgi:hypothetical protein
MRMWMQLYSAETLQFMCESILKLEMQLGPYIPDITVSHFSYEGICSPPVAPWLSIPIVAKITATQFGVRGFVQ